MILSMVFGLVLWCGSAFAGQQDLSFTWEQLQSDVEKVDFGGWKIYIAEEPGGPYGVVASVDFDGKVHGTYKGEAYVTGDGKIETKYFMLRAFNKVTGIESENSNEVSKELDFTNIFSIPVKFELKLKAVNTPLTQD